MEPQMTKKGRIWRMIQGVPLYEAGIIPRRTYPYHFLQVRPRGKDEYNLRCDITKHGTTHSIPLESRRSGLAAA